MTYTRPPTTPKPLAPPESTPAPNRDTSVPDASNSPTSPPKSTNTSPDARTVTPVAGTSPPSFAVSVYFPSARVYWIAPEPVATYKSSPVALTATACGPARPSTTTFSPGETRRPAASTGSQPELNSSTVPPTVDTKKSPAASTATPA